MDGIVSTIRYRNVGHVRLFQNVSFMLRERILDVVSVIARLDPKSGLPDFGIKLSKSETSDFDAIQYPPGPVATGSPGQAGR
jgi:hypothetical protein